VVNMCKLTSPSFIKICFILRRHGVDSLSRFGTVDSGFVLGRG
jgi:hypothetical protein